MLSNPRRLLCLKVLVLLSMAGSLGSVFTIRQGWGEIYPFTTWKLFTQPRGNKGQVAFYRIYLKEPRSGQYVRQPVKPMRTFTQDEYVYTLDYLVTEALPDSARQKSLAKEKVSAFVQYLYPEAEDYKIVRENYALGNAATPVVLLDTATLLTIASKRP